MNEIDKQVHELIGKCLHGTVATNAKDFMSVDCSDCDKTLSRFEYQRTVWGCPHSEKEPKFSKHRVCKFCGADDVSFDIPNGYVPYSTDISAALKVVEWLREQGYHFNIASEDTHYAMFIYYDDGTPVCDVTAESLPLAICEAALKIQEEVYVKD
jgi:Phage ABA sandwich domain